MKGRLFTLLGLTSLAFIFMSYNLYSLQINNTEYYTKRAQAQQTSIDTLLADRGTIYFTDKNNNQIPAAITKEYQVVFAVPSEIDDPQETSGRITTIIGGDPESLVEPLSNAKSQYFELIKRATDEQVQRITDAAIPGIYIKKYKGRFYPFGDLASQVLGFVGESQDDRIPRGQYGIEAQFDYSLTPQIIPGLKNETPEVTPGEDVTVTIDPNIQARAKEILSRLMDEYHPIGGTIIVQDPQNGKIMAMESAPSFNPNSYSDYPIQSFINPAIQSVYEPGSVAKVLTMAAGIDSGAITPETTYYDTGSFTANGMTIRNWDLKSHGSLTMTNVIEQSINTGTVFAQQKMGEAIFYNYLQKFGFKKLTGIELPGETAGKLTPLEQNKEEINFATASYGQGISVTPLRMISMVSAIANGGTLHRPFIREENKFTDSYRIFSEETAREVTDMMISAVDKNYVAKIPNFAVAGKSGTAFKPDFENGGYTDTVINTYIGFAPATNPRFTILVKIDEPENSPLAGQTVVPAFRELGEFLLNYYQLPPDRIE